METMPDLLPPAIVFVELPPFNMALDCPLDGGNDAAPLVGLLRGYHQVVVVDVDRRNDAGLAGYDSVEVADLADSGSLAQCHRRIAARLSVVAVVGFGETSVLATAYLAEAFGVRGIGREVALNCRDKYRMGQVLQAAGVASPRAFVTDDARVPDDQVTALGGYPLVCKPLMGFASYGVIRADNPDELHRAVRHIRRNNRFVMRRYYGDPSVLDQVLIQALVPGDEVAVDGYVEDGRVHQLMVIDKPAPAAGPYFADGLHILPSRLAEPATSRLAQSVRDCVLALGLDNTPFHLEAKIDGEAVTILEIGARVGFSRSVYHATGIDLRAITLALKLGQPVEATPRWQRYAGNHCIMASRMGRFAAIGNREAILAAPHMVDLPVFVEPGDRVAPAPDGNGYVGFLLAAADSYEEVAAALAQAADEVEVIIR